MQYIVLKYFVFLDEWLRRWVEWRICCVKLLLARNWFCKCYILPINRLRVPRKEKIVVGRKEIVDFPELNLWSVPAKVDTGADTSSIHVRKLKLEKRGDQAVLSCYFAARHKTVFTAFTQTMVKSSNGVKQARYVVKLKLSMFGNEYETDFTLSDRKAMAFPVLLGKKFLRKRFIVDVSLSNLSHKNKLISL